VLAQNAVKQQIQRKKEVQSMNPMSLNPEAIRAKLEELKKEIDAHAQLETVLNELAISTQAISRSAGIINAAGVLHHAELKAKRLDLEAVLISIRAGKLRREYDVINRLASDQDVQPSVLFRS